MASRKEREQIGPLVVTKASDLFPAGVVCAECGLPLATFEDGGDRMRPSPGQLVADGAVAVPNFGWFCSQACGDAYEAATGITFARDLRGNISYYP